MPLHYLITRHIVKVKKTWVLSFSTNSSIQVFLSCLCWNCFPKAIWFQIILCFEIFHLTRSWLEYINTKLRKSVSFYRGLNPHHLDTRTMKFIARTTDKINWFASNPSLHSVGYNRALNIVVPLTWSAVVFCFICTSDHQELFIILFEILIEICLKIQFRMFWKRDWHHLINVGGHTKQNKEFDSWKNVS